MKAKRLLALTLALVLLISCMSISALADGPEGTDLATTYTNYYKSQAGNYDLSNSEFTGGNYYLSTDLNLDLYSENCLIIGSINSGAPTSIDLYGHTLNLGNGYLMINGTTYNSPATIKDSVGGGKIILPGGSKIDRQTTVAYLALQSGTIEVSDNLSMECGLIMTGGSIEMKNKGCLTAGSADLNCTLTGGTISSPGADYGLIYNMYQTLTIGGSFSVPEGIRLNQGHVEFNSDLSNTIAFGGDNGKVISGQQNLTDNILEKIVARDSENQKVDYIHNVDEGWGSLQLVKNISVIYTAANPYPAVSSKESALDIGGISLNLFDNPVTYTCTVKDATAAAVDTITAVVDTEDGNKLKVTVNDAPVGNYTITVTASNETDGTASCDIPFVVAAFLDREENTEDIPQSYVIPQTYDLTVTELGNRDVTKVRVTWETEEITATSKRGKVWNPDTLAWVDDTKNLDNSASPVTAQFKLENLSSIKVRAEVSFAREASFTGAAPTVTFTDDSETTTDGKVLLDSVVKENDEVDTTIPHAANVTVALTPTASDFGTIAAGEGTYGNYTVKLVDPTSYTITANGSNFTADSNNATAMDEFTSTTLKYTAANDYIFSSKITFSGVANASDVTYNITDNGKTAIVTVKNPTADVVLNLNAVIAAKIIFQNFSESTLSIAEDYYVNVPMGSTVTYSEGGSTITATVKEGQNTYTIISISSDVPIKWGTTNETIAKVNNFVIAHNE